MPGLRIRFQEALGQLKKLASASSARADALEKAPGVIHTIPGSKWKHDLVAGDSLTAVGRTPVCLYLTSGYFERLKVDGSGVIF